MGQFILTGVCTEGAQEPQALVERRMIAVRRADQPLVDRSQQDPVFVGVRHLGIGRQIGSARLVARGAKAVTVRSIGNIFQQRDPARQNRFAIVDEPASQRITHTDAVFITTTVASSIYFP